MGRFNSSGSTGHRCRDLGGYYRISWVVDYHYSDSRLRFPRLFSRITDEKGARRFCKKWGIEFPEPKEAAE